MGSMKRRGSVSANFSVINDLIEKGDARQLRALLVTAPTLRATLKGTTEPALHVAMQRLQLACVEVITDAGVNTNATRPSDGRTALHCAVESGFIDGVRHLLSRRAKIDLADNMGHTAVHLAAASQLPDAENILAFLLESGASVSSFDTAGCTSAHFAAAAGNVLMIELIDNLDPGLVTVADQQGATPLHHACSTGALPTIEWLVDRRSRVAINAATHDKSLPITHAARSGRHEVVALLLRMNAWELEQRLPGGQTLLMIACQEDDNGLLEQLLQVGADPNAVDDLGRGALMHAAISDAQSCILTLLGREVDAQAVDSKSSTALMLAACNMAPNAVEALIKGAGVQGCALMARDMFGRTVLMQILLLRQGATHRRKAFQAQRAHRTCRERMTRADSAWHVQRANGTRRERMAR